MKAKNFFRIIVIAAFFITGFILSAGDASAQSLTKGDVEIPVTSAVPFLRIVPDARAGGMGEAGIATAAEAASIFHNPANLAFAEKRMGAAINYAPWLKSLVSDMNLANLAGYYKPDKKQAVGLSMRYFSMGNIQFTDANGGNTGEFSPHEISFDAAYARRLAEFKKGGGFSAGLALRFIYSSLATGQSVEGTEVKAGMAGAADIAFAFNKNFKVRKKYKANFAMGLNISNMGSKMSYTESSEKDFLPMNFGFGTRYSLDIDKHNQLSFAVDMNKLLVPGNDSSGTSVPAAIFSSWGDAPGGFSEEMREITWSLGMEYWYNQVFALRTGYFHENENKGNRKFVTAGLGLRLNVFGLDFSYVIPASSQRHPLDNTMRFSLLFQFDKNKKKQEGNEATGSL